MYYYYLLLVSTTFLAVRIITYPHESSNAASEPAIIINTAKIVSYQTQKGCRFKMMLTNDKNYVKNKTRMRINQLKKHNSANVVNSASLLTNIPTVSSVGPSIIRDNSDEEDMVSDIVDDEEVSSEETKATENQE